MVTEILMQGCIPAICGNITPNNLPQSLGAPQLSALDQLSGRLECEWYEKCPWRKIERRKEAHEREWCAWAKIENRR